MELTTGGIIFMVIAYGTIFSLIIICYYHILKKKGKPKNTDSDDIVI